MTNIDKIKKFIVILSIILININYGINTIYAHESISFKNITINDGLSQGTVPALLQDKQGRIWIGTDDGLDILLRDSDSILRFKELDNDGKILGNLKITSLLKDNIEDVMWIGTENGLMKIDIKNDKMETLYHDENNKN